MSCACCRPLPTRPTAGTAEIHLSELNPLCQEFLAAIREELHPNRDGAIRPIMVQLGSQSWELTAMVRQDVISDGEVPVLTFTLREPRRR